jgi:hypothetical protein
MGQGRVSWKGSRSWADQAFDIQEHLRRAGRSGARRAPLRFSGADSRTGGSAGPGEATWEGIPRAETSKGGCPALHDV